MTGKYAIKIIIIKLYCVQPIHISIMSTPMLSQRRIAHFVSIINLTYNLVCHILRQYLIAIVQMIRILCFPFFADFSLNHFHSIHFAHRFWAQILLVCVKFRNMRSLSTIYGKQALFIFLDAFPPFSESTKETGVAHIPKMTIFKIEQNKLHTCN